MVPRRVVSLEVQLPSESQESRIWPLVVLVGMLNTRLGCCEQCKVPSGVPTPGVLLLPVPGAEDGGHYQAPGAAQWCTVPPTTPIKSGSCGPRAPPSPGEHYPGISFISRVQPWPNPIPPIWRKGRDEAG